ncbi:Excinuclease ABC C subunit domain protein [Hymenobacter roseosalivarius DSM 11622]|uniref:Excinuclease ABC C subunit domain protein n=1 Tax=Hymenobacter roseosalivarius DSM 11622 TaxID=645990 RepID=A0A1W1VYD0_9BACT|nr:GIY-YIG nuclease family protein [Hymenobacter roseosalivarius]SMB98253.1 Excinuclease ABC C subunit domain protein [Hymenobacter roseosalivarius DSM 11622]
MPYYVYITTNPAKTVLYIGITNSLPQRMAQHYDNRGTNQTFAGRYFCYNLVYFEEHMDSKTAIARENELKGWTRAKKEALIASENPEWLFLQS